MAADDATIANWDELVLVKIRREVAPYQNCFENFQRNDVLIKRDDSDKGREV